MPSLYENEQRALLNTIDSHMQEGRPSWAYRLTTVEIFQEYLQDPIKPREEVLAESFINLEARFKVERRNVANPKRTLIHTVEEGVEFAKKLAEESLFYRKKILEEIIPSMPWDIAYSSLIQIKNFATPSEQTEYVDYLLKNKAVECAFYAAHCGFTLEQRQIEELHHIKNLLDSTAVAEAKPIDDNHASLYGGNQESYKTYHNTTVKLIADAIKNGLQTIDQVASLIQAVAERRKNYAYQSDTEDKQEFGLPRFRTNIQRDVFGDIKKQNHQVHAMATPMAGHYSKYAQKVHDIIKIQLDGTLLTVIMPVRGTYTWHHLAPDNAQALIQKLQQEYKDLSNTTFFEPIETAKRIGHFHWLAANLMPWNRGSAAIIEQLTDAIWVKNFGCAPEKPAGLSLDCEALIQPDREAYTKEYASFFSVLPKAKINHTAESAIESKEKSTSLASVNLNHQLSQTLDTEIDRILLQLQDKKPADDLIIKLEAQIQLLEKDYGKEILKNIIHEIALNLLYHIRNTRSALEENGIRSLLDYLYQHTSITEQIRNQARDTDSVIRMKRQIHTNDTLENDLPILPPETKATDERKSALTNLSLFSQKSQQKEHLNANPKPGKK